MLIGFLKGGGFPKLASVLPWVDSALQYCRRRPLPHWGGKILTQKHGPRKTEKCNYMKPRTSFHGLCCGFRELFIISTQKESMNQARSLSNHVPHLNPSSPLSGQCSTTPRSETRHKSNTHFGRNLTNTAQVNLSRGKSRTRTRVKPKRVTVISQRKTHRKKTTGFRIPHTQGHTFWARGWGITLHLTFFKFGMIDTHFNIFKQHTVA